MPGERSDHAPAAAPSHPVVRVRIAPSPTGRFHVGNARTALFNWLFARQSGGAFVCRVEDTDRSRFVEGAFEDMVEALRWLDIEPDEGPIGGGPYGPYRQSERLPLYREHAAQLLAGGHAYRCFCSEERLAGLREGRRKRGAQPVYDRRCRGLDDAEAEARVAGGESWVVRLRMPSSGSIEMVDMLRGRIAFDAAELEDIVLQKSDGFPTYHLAVVVDDHAMAITHVLRADEWIPSAPYQIVLYAALGWQAPVWVHLPMVLNPDGKGKLAKRKTVEASGETSQQMTQVREFRAAGYLPEALLNYLALLGWAYSGDEDIFTREQALERFKLEQVRTAPAAWDGEKLAWMNGAYIRQLDPDDLAERLMPFLREEGLAADLDTVRRLAPLIRERLTTLREAPPWLAFVWQDVQPDMAQMLPPGLDAGDTGRLLATVEESLRNLDTWRTDAIEQVLRGLAEELGLKLKHALQPVRVATTGQAVSPPLFESIAVLGRDKTLQRLSAARSVLAAARDRDA